MSPRVRTRHGEVTAELAWSGSGSRSEITPAVGRTVHLPPNITKISLNKSFFLSFSFILKPSPLLSLIHFDSSCVFFNMSLFTCLEFEVSKLKPKMIST
ncbi:hypothetical protein Hanom_Chr03g00250571 [Helianthus anomalus]